LFNINLDQDLDDYVQARILDTALKAITFYQSGDISSALTNFDKLGAWTEFHQFYFK
jgi:hypothetical protein